MKGHQGKDYAVFCGNFLGAGSQNCTIPRGNWKLATGVTGTQNYAIPKGNCQLAVGDTSSRNYAIPRGNWQSTTRGCWQGKLH